MSHSKLLVHSLGCVGASLLGAGIAWMSVPSEEEATEPTQQQEVRKSGTTGSRPELLDVLVEITAPKEADLNLKATGSYENQALSLVERHRMLSQLIDEGKGSPGMEAERDQLWAEALKRFSLWISEDHEEALRALDDPEASLHALAVVCLTNNPDQLVDLLGFESYFDRVAGIPAAAAGSGQFLGQYLGEQANLARLAWAMKNHQALVFKPRALAELGRAWPLNQKDALFGAIQNSMSGEEKGPSRGAEALVALAKRMPDFAGLEWVLSLYQKEDLAPGLKVSIARNVVALTEQEGLPLPERLQALRDFGVYQRMTDHRAQAQLIYFKVNELLRSDDDFLYAFRNGATSSKEMFDHIYEGMPEFHTYSGEVRAHILRRLAEHDSEATRELVSGGSAQDQAAELVNATRWSFYQIKPGQLADWHDGIGQLDPKQEGYMAQVWKERTNGHLHRYGPAYYDWLAQMPPGTVRDQAISAALPQARKNESDHVSKLESLIGTSK